MTTSYWIKAETLPTQWKCAHCEALSYSRSNYCPNCGARMTGDKKPVEKTK